MRQLILLLLVSLPAFATKTLTSSVAFTDAQGNVCANCTIIFQLNQSAKLIAGGQIIPNPPIKMTLTAGGLAPAAFVITAQDEMQPTGTAYIVNIYNANGSKVRGPESWILQGASPIDLSTITNSVLPDPGLANPVIQNPSAAQTITGFGLTFTNTAPVTFQGATTFSGSPTIASPTFATSVNGNGSGFKHARAAGCSTTTVQFSTCTVTLTWVTPFADANYTVTCFTPVVTGTGILNGSAKSASTVSLFATNLFSGSVFNPTEIDCIAAHD